MVVWSRTAGTVHIQAQPLTSHYSSALNVSFRICEMEISPPSSAAGWVETSDTPKALGPVLGTLSMFL